MKSEVRSQKSEVRGRGATVLSGVAWFFAQRAAWNTEACHV